MALKTAEYYQHHALDELLQQPFTPDDMSALLSEQLHSDNLKWELAAAVRQNYDLRQVKSELDQRDDDVQTQQQYIAQQTQYIAELEDSVAYFKDAVAGLQAHIENYEARMAVLDQAIADARAETRALQQSFSWRITRPLRTLRNFFNH